MTPSTEQLACVAAATGSADNLLISACAGGAKSTTLGLIARALGPGRRIVAIPFAKDAAEALRAKMPYFVEVSTFHAFCYDALGKFLGKKPRPDGNRTKWMLKEMVPDWKTRVALEGAVLTLVSRAKSCGIRCGGVATWSQLADRFDIEATQREFDLADEIIDKCDEDKAPKTIDFDDMLWLTLRWSVPFPPIAVVLLDEAQDTNSVQRALLSAMLDPKGERPCLSYNGFAEPHSDIDACCNCGMKRAQHGRLIAVGDPHQSIYGFRGADANAMEALRAEFAMRELSLSVSYRCSKAVVAEAQKYL